MRKLTEIKREVLKQTESHIGSESNTTKFHYAMGVLSAMCEDEMDDFYLDLDTITRVKAQYEILKHYGLHK